MRPEQLGRYKLIDELARNASGVVYKASDPLIDRIVTIKTVDLDLPPDEVEAFQKRLDREVRAVGRLNHPNIVTIHDVGRSGDVTYIAMEFMDGRSLRDMLDSGAVLLPARIADIAAQIADGLDFVHRHGIVHRDIKPDNITVLRSGVVKITNFGIARVSDGSRTMIKTSLGSPVYISPEQMMGRKVDERSDVFSLGAVLYELLTGRPPFAIGELSQIIHQVIHEAPLPPTNHNRSVALAFDDIVAKAMAKNPNDRYRSAREMALDLRKLAPGASDMPADVPAIAERARASGQPGDDAVLVDCPVVDVVTSKVSTPENGTTAAPWLRRRKPMLYGMVTAALLAGGGWTLLSRPMATPSTIDGRNVSSVAHQAKAPPVQDPLVDGASATTQAATRIEPSAAPNLVSPPAQVAYKGIAAPAQRTARLALAVSPWGEVFIDGDSKGTCPPLTEVRLTPGKHTIEIRNTNFTPYSQAVELRANSRLQIKYKFN